MRGRAASPILLFQDNTRARAWGPSTSFSTMRRAAALILRQAIALSEARAGCAGPGAAAHARCMASSTAMPSPPRRRRSKAQPLCVLARCSYRERERERQRERERDALHTRTSSPLCLSRHTLALKTTLDTHTHSPRSDSPADLDPAEVAKFASASGHDWWDPAGPAAPLHAMNPARVLFARRAICEAHG